MSRRIYVAAPWIARNEAKDLAHTLTARGYDITQGWWNYEGKGEVNDLLDFEYPVFLRMCGELDVRGVRTADAIVLLNSSKSEGKAVEQGLAIAYGLPIIAIGKLGEHSQNVFHYLDLYHWVPDISAAISKLEEIFDE